MTEDTPWRATTGMATGMGTGKMRAALDKKYLAAHKAGCARDTLGRSADFVGPRVLNSTLGRAAFPAALTPDGPHPFGPSGEAFMNSQG
ncbi:hypothetical protein [Streptomyces chrestomyceticus]|uniref:hypothetical protein n=1 Tax=Streptomyces chrestomyceticus TaxID=68185 RepID=UPI0039E0D0FB